MEIRSKKRLIFLINLIQFLAFNFFLNSTKQGMYLNTNDFLDAVNETFKRSA